MIGNKVAIIGSDIDTGIIQGETKTLINVKLDGSNEIVKVRKSNNMVQGGVIAIMTNFDDDNSARAFSKLKMMNEESKGVKEALITFIVNTSNNQIIEKMKNVMEPPKEVEDKVEKAEEKPKKAVAKAKKAKNKSVKE